MNAALNFVAASLVSSAVAVVRADRRDERDEREERS